MSTGPGAPPPPTVSAPTLNGVAPATDLVPDALASPAAASAPVINEAANPESSSRGPRSLAAAFEPHQLSLASRSVHADDYVNNHRAVAPPMHVSTTFRYDEDPEGLVPGENVDPNAPYDSHMYSRDTGPNATRLEAILTNILGAPCLTYASGLAAFHAMLVFLNPRTIAIGNGYHGCHGVIRLLSKLTGLRQVDLGTASDADALAAQLGPGDMLHVETPLNPTGEVRDLAFYRRVADRAGCYLTVDATFAPPPLMDPFAEPYRADVIMHSGTKYIGGHSDILCGVLAVRPDRAAGPGGWIDGLRGERVYLGSVMGSLEGWLGVRSVRTLELRVLRQSESATKLVAWLAGELGAGASPAQANGEAVETAEGGKTQTQPKPESVVAQLLAQVHHASVQPEAHIEDSWLRRQMPRGYGPVFALRMRSADDARRLPSKLRLFHHATSLGGVESLIEWRAMTDRTVEKTILRVSVGVEAWEDLKLDLEQAFCTLLEERRRKVEVNGLEGTVGHTMKDDQVELRVAGAREPVVA